MVIHYFLREAKIMSMKNEITYHRGFRYPLV